MRKFSEIHKCLVVKLATQSPKILVFWECHSSRQGTNDQTHILDNNNLSIKIKISLKKIRSLRNSKIKFNCSNRWRWIYARLS